MRRPNLRALLSPAQEADTGLDLASAIQGVAGSTVNQTLVSALLLALVSGVVYAMHAWVWLSLFVMLLLPTGLSCALLLVVQLRYPKGASWPRTWCLLSMGLLLGTALAWLLYVPWNAYIGNNGLSPPQFMASVLGFGLLTVALPLWNAQSKMRSVQWAELKHTAMSAQLKALQAQVEPHFLYNTLANARYLTRQDPQRATQMLDHLIAYLRTSVPDMRSPVSTLGREFDLAEHYLQLMAIRFGERLHFDLHLADDLRSQPVPPLMLMTLVENAVQHGVEPQPGDVTIVVSAHLADGMLQVQVRNNGAGLQDKVLGSGVGLRNLRERMHALYGARATFTLCTMEDGQVAADIRLPLVVHR